jgi:hypothetical protein
MLKETLKFKDYNDNDREVTVYFHLTETEIVELQLRSPEGIEKELQDAIKSNDPQNVWWFLKDLVDRSYGIKSLDGIHFTKNPQILAEFQSTAYYSDFLLGLVQNDGAKGMEFVKGIFPKNLVERATAQIQGQQAGPADRTTYGLSAREQFEAAQAKASAQLQQAPVAQVQQPEPVQQVVSEPVQSTPAFTQQDLADFNAWKAAQNQQASVPVAEVGRTEIAATPVQSAPETPDAFRIPAGPESA